MKKIFTIVAMAALIANFASASTASQKMQKETITEIQSDKAVVNFEESIDAIGLTEFEASCTSIWDREFSIHWNLLIAGIASTLVILILAKDAIKGKSKEL